MVLIKNETSPLFVPPLQKTPRDAVKNFHNVNLRGFLGLGWASGSKLNGEKIRD